MGSNQSATAETDQSILNNIINDSSEECNATCNNNVKDMVFNISGSGAEQFGITQVCSANANCIMKTQLTTNIQNVLDSMVKQQQSASKGFLPSLSGNNQETTAITRQNINNQISQIMQSSCNALTSNTAVGNIVNISNNETNPNNTKKVVGVTQTGSANATCSITNVGNIVVSNKETSTISQSQTIQVIGIGITSIALILIVLPSILTIGKVRMASIAAKEKIEQFKDIADAVENKDFRPPGAFKSDYESGTELREIPKKESLIPVFRTT